MSLFDKLTAKNFSAYAMKHYDDPQCESLDDFQDDLRRFRYLKRLLYRYHEFGESRERLMLNHLICLFNVFGYDPCMRMLEFKIKEDKYWSTIKTLLLYMQYVREDWRPEIAIDGKLVTKLREL